MSKAYTEQELKDAYQYYDHNRLEIQKSKKCACFSCMRIILPEELKNYWEEHEQTTICPYCKTDAILPDSSGLPIEDLDFLNKMKTYWF